MSRRLIIRTYVANGVSPPLCQGFPVYAKWDMDILYGETKTIRTGIFFPDHNQSSLDLKVLFARCDYMPLKATLIEHELVVIVLFNHSDGGIKLNSNEPIANIRIKNHETVAFVDITKEIISEKQIKGWLRRYKLSLLENFNSEWKDLY